MRAVLQAQINKTDRNDARGIAQMMRVGLYRPVHVKTLRSQKTRMLLTHRKLLQSKAIAIDNDLRGTLRNFAMARLPSPSRAQSGLLTDDEITWPVRKRPDGYISCRSALPLIPPVLSGPLEDMARDAGFFEPGRDLTLRIALDGFHVLEIFWNLVRR